MRNLLTSLTGLYELHKRQVLNGGYLHADETTTKFQDENKKGKTHLGNYWVYQNSEQKSEKPDRSGDLVQPGTLDKLSIYASDAKLSIDNNAVERAIRPVAIGSKNYLFAGSHDAAQRVAMIYFLFATCTLQHINQCNWLKIYWKECMVIP